MIISQIIFIVFLIFLLIDYKKTVLVYTPLRLLFNSTFVAFQFGEVILSLNNLISLLIFLLFLFKIRIKKPNNPLIWSLLFSAFALITVLLFSLHRSSVFNTYAHITRDALYPLIFWYFLKTSNDIKLVVKSYIYVCVVICVYALIEFLLGFNPLLNWLAENTTSRVFVNHINDIRFGFGRYNSFMFYPVSFGAVCAIFFSFIIYYHKKFNDEFLRLKLLNYSILLILLISGVILSNSRATLMCLLIGILHTINFTLFKSKKGWMILFLILVIGFVLSDYIYMTIESILINKADDVGGSSAEMRRIQLLESLKYFWESPIFGNGNNYLTYIQDSDYKELMGAESYWFVLLIERGLVGIIAYIYMIINLSIFLGKKHLRFGIILTLSWVVLTSMSLIIGIDISYLICLMLIVYKSELIHTKKRNCYTRNRKTYIDTSIEHNNSYLNRL